MAHDPENPFADMDVDWESIEKAKPGAGIGRIAPYNAYKGVCVAFDPKGDGHMVDREVFETPAGTRGVKIAIEIMDPENVEGEITKGKIYEHVFWITQPNWPYAKRDAATILGKELSHPKELAANSWAGKTVEFGLKDETYNGFVRSKTTHFNPWTPEASKGPAAPPKKGAAPASTAGAPKKGAPPRQPATAGKEADIDF